MFVCVPEPVCQTERGKLSSNPPPRIFLQALMIALPNFLSNFPSAILTFAAACLIAIIALIKG